jgi:hypothetical protein
MAVNLIVGGVTLFLASAVLVWLAWPAGRRLIEAPKYQPLDWDREAAISARRRAGR